MMASVASASWGKCAELDLSGVLETIVHRLPSHCYQTGLVVHFPARKDVLNCMLHITRALGFPEVDPVLLLCQDFVRIKKGTEEDELSCSPHDEHHFNTRTLTFPPLADPIPNRKRL